MGHKSRRNPLFDPFLAQAKSRNKKDNPILQRTRRVGREARKHKKLLLFSGITILTLLVLAPIFWLSYDDSWRLSNNTGGLRAALVDELSTSYQDPAFVANTTSTLTTAGYRVDYYGPSQVTVGFFRDLPARNYGLVIIRAHSGVSSIYTSEPYSKWTNVYEQLTDQVIRVVVDNVEYFGITASFVQNSMRGSLHGTLIVTMGCGGLADTSMANAFIQKGAASYVGWDRWVEASTTDRYTMTLVHSLSQGKTMKESVGIISSKLSIDPSYAGRLGYYDASTAPKEHATSFLNTLGIVATITSFVAVGPLVAFFVVKAVSGELRLNPLAWKIRRGHANKP